MRQISRTLFAILALSMFVLSDARAAGPAVGDKAPAFEARDDSGKVWKSEDHVGKKVLVVYFFPADFTGGCTKQACGYRDDMAALSDKGVEVVGVSGDKVETHEKFKKEHKLPFTLLSDEKGELATKLGIPAKVEAATAKVKVDGKDVSIERGATIQRWTVVIGKDGKIAYKEAVKDAAGDAKKILEVVQKLKGA
jgi:peroxiredoxin Q/BCP